MEEKILSVSIAAYNVENTLREALEPFKQSGVREYVDVMIVDDGSKDQTACIAREYENLYPDTFRLISKENGGWGSTLNVGIQEARGKYFKQLDGDDYYSWENLAAFIHYLSKTDADLIHSPYVTFEDKTGAILNVLGDYQGEYRFFPRDRVVPVNECTALLPAMHSFTVRAKILKENNVQITEHCFYTDVEFVLKSLNLSTSIAFFEQPVYYYRLARNGQSMSQAGVRKHYKDHQKMLFNMLSYYKENVTDPAKKKIFEQRLDGACNMQYIFYFALECTAKQKKELKAYDAYLKHEYPDFYERVRGRQVNFLRKTDFCGYWLVARQKMIKDKLKKQNIFEGC